MRIVFVPKNSNEANTIKKQLFSMKRDDIIVICKEQYQKNEHDIVEFEVEPNKEYGLLLDYGGNVERFGAIDAQPTSKQILERDPDAITTAPFKICTNHDCRLPNHAKAIQCEYCGEVFERKEQHGVVAAEGSLFVHDKPTNERHWIDVQAVEYAHHIGRDSGKESMRVTYYANFTHEICSEYVSLRVAEWKIKPRIGYPYEVPDTIEQLVNDCKKSMPLPSRINIAKNGKYMEVKGYDFSPRKALSA